MVKWSEICKPKDQGGLGVISSKRMDIALLLKWLWRIQTEEGGLWLEIIRAKYLRGQPLAFASRSSGSQFWQSVIRLMPVLRIGTAISVGSGAGTLFWLDRWAGPRSFAVRFPSLFSICTRPLLSVAVALADLGVVTFRRTFGAAEREQWDELVECIALRSPSLEPDTLSWHLEPNGRFSTRSLYQVIVPTPGPAELCVLWEINLPLKIRIFLWQWVRGRLPSGTEVRKRMALGMAFVPFAWYRKTATTSSCDALRCSSYGVASGRWLVAIGAMTTSRTCLGRSLGSPALAVHPCGWRWAP